MAGLRLAGRLASGLGEGAIFTRAAWARDQFVARLGIDPFPGTVNLALESPAERAKWARLRATEGVVIEAPDPAWCNGRCYPATILGRDGTEIAGAVVLPEVPGYPDDKVELIAEIGVRNALALDDGDPVVIEVAVDRLGGAGDGA